MSYKVFDFFLAAFPLEGTDPGRPENQVMSSFLFIVVASDEESVYRKNIFASTARNFVPVTSLYETLSKNTQHIPQ